MQLIYYNSKSNCWELNTHEIIYTQHGEDNIKSYTNNVEWWVEFSKKWPHTTINEIKELEFTEAQMIRYAYIKNLKNDYGHIYSYYVETGDVHEEVKDIPLSHPFHITTLKYKEVKELEDRLLSPIEIYDRLNKVDAAIDELKEAKKNKLSYQCTQTILGRFKCKLEDIEYEFSYDTEAQLQFTGTCVLMFSGRVSEIEWTAYTKGERVRIVLDVEDFNAVSNAALNHQNSNIINYNKLLIELSNCKTLDEIESVNWTE